MSFTGLILAATIAGAFQTEPTSGHTSIAPMQANPRDRVAQVDDVIVQGNSLRGMSLRDQTEAFVDEVAAPASRRGLARWDKVGRVCVGVVNVRNDVAQALVDHVSRMAVDVGLRVGDPGCRPSVVIIFTDDANGVASTLVGENRRAFHLGVGGLDRGSVALRAFQSSDLPVRWWHVSLPVVGVTGEKAIRLPGDSRRTYVPGEGRVNSGRPVTDIIYKAIIIVDMNQMNSVPLPQLADYIGMVSLLQVDPDGDTSRFESILNLFDDSNVSDGLSSWDRSYLSSLYNHYSQRINPRGQAAEMARGIIRAERAELRDAAPQR